MTWARYFKLSSYGLITSGFVAVAATGSVDLFSLLLFGSALVSSWFVDTAALNRRIPRWAMNALMVGYLPGYLVDYHFLSRSFVVSTIHLIFYVAAVKVLTRLADSDYVYLYCISFAELLAASILTVDITFLVSLLVFLLCAVSTLMLFEMRRAQARFLKRGDIRPFLVSREGRSEDMESFAAFPSWSLAATTLAMTALIMLVAIPLFLLLPRIAFGMYSRPEGKLRMTSGFSESVELGAIGAIKESDAVVMKVRLNNPPGPLPADLKWRGIALDTYDGRSWSKSNVTRQRVSPEGDYFRLERSIQGTRLLTQTFFVEALTTDVVFASHKVLAVSSDLGFLQRDSGGSIHTLRHDTRKIRYRAVSDITAPDPDLIPSRPGPLPEPIGKTCLQLPALDARIAVLARKATGAASHPYDKALSLERYLRTSYEYSLELKGSPRTRDPLAAFLFDIRKGHCEYFASAMAIMLRQLGIPSRLVNGFRAGEYNRLADAFVVRQYDAHSWVEAYFAPYGWVEFDPTPADPSHSRSTLARMLSTLADAAGLWWWEEVISYDVRKQFQVISSTRSAASEFQHWLKKLLQDFLAGLRATGDRASPGMPRQRLFLIIAGLSACSGIALFLYFARNAPGLSRLRRFLFGVAFSGDKDRLITRCYREALGLLARYGIARNPDLTPLEFSRSLTEHAVGTPLAELTAIYNRVRFGSYRTDEDLNAAAELLDALRSKLRSG